MLNSMSKISGQFKQTVYPQTEAQLGDCMLLYGTELGKESAFGNALRQAGECMKQMADVKDCFDFKVKQNFLDPLESLKSKELKEITHHLKKLEGRRLDYDYNKRHFSKVTEEEVKQAEGKFMESTTIAKTSMHNFLENDIEQVSQLASFIEAVLNYHKQSANILEDLHRQFQKQLNRQPPPEEPSHMTCPLTKEATCTGLHKSVRVHKETSREKGELQPKQTQPSGECSATHKKERHVSFSSGSSEQLDQPCCRALYDFEPENEGELRFKEGDIITLTNQLDDNWFEGMLNYESGFFPVNHVEVLVHLPK
ncbi:endophilin-A3 [Pleurodeles waltl]|uniref:endophilin-A3 n=1 Tax=Pleurodeles waltl TaxID=8319 RepID=UPI0037096D06